MKMKPGAKKTPTSTNVYVRGLNNDYEHAVAFFVDANPDTAERKLERMVGGMLINMNTEEYVVDTSEVDATIARLRAQ
jgi:hypothetical protein